MSRISDSRDPSGIGIPILQHHEFPAKGWSLDLRGGLLAVRVIDRNDTDPDGLGAWLLDADATGDITNALAWPAAKNVPSFGNLTRRQAGWSWAWSSVAAVIEGSGTPTQGAAGGGHCAVLADDQSGMSPVRDARVADPRYQPLNLVRPPVWPKFPSGYYGITLAAANEEKQIEFFHPTDPRLIAVNRKGDVAMGSLVCDMDSNFELDPTRQARLQSHLWVIKQPQGCVDFRSQNALAWNLGLSGCEDVRGGLVIDRPKGSAVGYVAPIVATDRVIGTMGAYESGPIEVGSDHDKHLIGEDADKHKIMAAHISTDAYFRANVVRDAPLLFETDFVSASQAPVRTHVHLKYDSRIPHPFVCGPRLGMWRWYAESFFYAPPIETPNSAPKPRPGRGPGEEVPPVRPPVETQSARPRTAEELPVPGPGIAESFEESLGQPPPSALEPKRGGPMIGVWDRSFGAKRYAASTMEVAAPAFLARAQLFRNGLVDLRGDLSPSDAAVAHVDAFWPIVSRIEAFGNQRGTGWQYTQEPGKGRYRNGTASGGLAYLNPETDMTDRAADFAQDGTTLSTTYHVAVPGVYWATGYPDETTGGIDTGWRWGGDSSGNLDFERVNASGTVTKLVRLDVSDTGNLGKVLIGTTTFVNQNNSAGLSKLTVSSDVINDGLFLEGFSNAGSARCAVLQFYRREGAVAAAANDRCGRIDFSFMPTNGGVAVAADIYAKVLDPTSGLQDGELTLETMSNGSLVEHVRMSGDTSPPRTLFNPLAVDMDTVAAGDVRTYDLFLDSSEDNLALCASAAPAWNSLQGGLFIENAIRTPTGNPTGGGYLYATGGAGTWRGSGGTTTTFGPAEPHCPRCGSDFALSWTNPKYGKLSLCLQCLAKTLDISGKLFTIAKSEPWVEPPRELVSIAA